MAFVIKPKFFSINYIRFSREVYPQDDPVSPEESYWTVVIDFSVFGLRFGISFHFPNPFGSVKPETDSDDKKKGD